MSQFVGPVAEMFRSMGTLGSLIMGSLRCLSPWIGLLRCFRLWDWTAEMSETMGPLRCLDEWEP